MGKLCFFQNSEMTRSFLQLNNYMTHRLPMVECCGCTEKNGDKCPDNGCHKKCRGNYCVVDFEGVEQGCGLGYPRLQNFLRMNNYLHFQGQQICARYGWDFIVRKLLISFFQVRSNSVNSYERMHMYETVWTVQWIESDQDIPSNDLRQQ